MSTNLRLLKIFKPNRTILLTNILFKLKIHSNLLSKKDKLLKKIINKIKK